MQKLFYSIRNLGLAAAFVASAGLNVFSQAFTENFDDITLLAGNGWFLQNNSSPVGITNWFQGTSVAGGGPFDSFNGAANSYIGANFNNTTGGTGIISTWLLTPNRTFRNGDVIQFYTRKPATPVGGTDYPDRLEVRLSTNGASTNIGAAGNNVGDFTTLLLSVNPTLVAGGYPFVWTQYTITLSGLPAPTSGRVAFRYFVTGAGPSGANSDYIGIDNIVYTPYVCPTVSITTPSLPNGTAGTAYNQNLSQTGALGTPNFAVTAGALPAGLTLSASGVISGTPTATGTFNFTVTVSDNSGCSGSAAYSITVVCPTITVNPSSLPGATAGASYSQNLSQSGGFGTVNYAITSGALPAGLGFAGGVISGTPTATGTFNFTVTATDASGCIGSTAYSITVVCPANPITFSAFPAICSADAAVTLSEASPAGGTYSGTGVSGGQFNPASGTQNITYDYVDPYGCAHTSNQTFTVTATPATPTITASASTAICDGSSITLSSSASSGNTWSSGETTQDITVNTANTFTVTVSENGCSSAASSAITTTIVDLASPSFTISGTSPTFNFSSTSQNTTSVSWNFGDGSPADNNTNTSHTYTTNGTFTVTLTATNECGSETTTETVTVFGININEVELFENMNLFPVPSNENLTIQFFTASDKEVRLKVLDLQGKLIHFTSLGTVNGNHTSTIDISSFAAGTYSLILESADGYKAVKRFVKM